MGVWPTSTKREDWVSAEPSTMDRKDIGFYLVEVKECSNHCDESKRFLHSIPYSPYES